MARPLLVVCMGVSGSGKTTLARRLASRLEWRFVDADDFHSLAARRQMASGIPLTDADRDPWMQRISSHLCDLAEQQIACVLAHSGLRAHHRAALRRCGFDTCFLRLDGDVDVLRQRIEQRQAHFMPASLIASQIRALESTDAEDDVARLDAHQTQAALAEQAAAIVAKLQDPARV